MGEAQFEWKVEVADHRRVAYILNELEAQGFEIFQIHPNGGASQSMTVLARKDLSGT